MSRLAPLVVLLLAVSGCTPDGSAADRGAAPGEVPRNERRADTPPPLPREWESAPSRGVLVTGGDTLRVETGPHAVLWPAGASPVDPPYTVRARFRKRHGRLHEGYGLVFGGSPLAAPEERQRYSYFLVRGDGSYLIKRRQGAETPVVRPWTFHPAIRRDTEEGGEPNELEVRVGEEEVAFRVNGAEVARIPAAELDTRGVAGIRAAHDVQLAVTRFEVSPGASALAAP